MIKKYEIDHVSRYSGFFTDKSYESRKMLENQNLKGVYDLKNKIFNLNGIVDIFLDSDLIMDKNCNVKLSKRKVSNKPNLLPGYTVLIEHRNIFPVIKNLNRESEIAVLIARNLDITPSNIIKNQKEINEHKRLSVFNMAKYLVETTVNEALIKQKLSLLCLDQNTINNFIDKGFSQ